MGFKKKYLFISKRCPHSKSLMKILGEDNNSDLYQSLTIINVDKTKQIPNYIKKVPSLLYEEESTTILLVGSKIFEWVFKENNANQK
jgi:hypothetical protein